MNAKQRLYLTADRQALVTEGDDRAATLYCNVGDEIPDSAAELFGLVDGGLPKPDDAGDGEDGDQSPAPATPAKAGKRKQAAAPANKESGIPADKAANPGEPQG